MCFPLRRSKMWFLVLGGSEDRIEVEERLGLDLAWKRRDVTG